jgi:hypothetical protein
MVALLLVADVGQRRELIPELRRPLEVHLTGRLAHAVLAFPDQVVYAPLQEGDDVGDDLVVVLL